MESNALLCPQCGGGLPLSARWRSVVCRYCGVAVAPAGIAVVMRADFTRALVQARAQGQLLAELRCGGDDYQVLDRLGSGEHSEVLLLQRVGAPPRRLLAKVAANAIARQALADEARQLTRLHALSTPAAAVFNQRMPCSLGVHAANWRGRDCEVHLLRQPAGLWGSLADVIEHQPGGVDPRHAVWIWRRLLEFLGYLHAQGWCHGDVAPEHAVVEPVRHGIVLVGWARARAAEEGGAAGQREDLLRAAWVVRSVLHGQRTGTPDTGDAPAPLARLLRYCCTPDSTLLRAGAEAIEAELSAAAQAAYGAARFIYFDPASRPG